MFIVKATFDDQIEISNGISAVRDFFLDSQNFVEYMPNVESIKAISEGIMRWTIGVDFPVIGKIKQDFMVENTASTDYLIEWSPKQDDSGNFLRYSADFLAKSATETIVRLQQHMELRRTKPSQLHALAGFAGAGMISREMADHIQKTLRDFLSEAKKKLER